MSTLHIRFLQPLDVLFLRGNKLFGDAGSYGEALIPPWPSVAAGALRSRMMADDPALTAIDLQDPARFALTAFHLARRVNGSIETLHAPPADLAITEPEAGQPVITALRPHIPAAGLLSSAPLPQIPVLAEAQRSKPVGGYWLNAEGWAAYLNGETPQAEHLVKTAELWALDHRVGVGLDSATRRADDGKLFSVQAIAFKPDVGFLVGVRAENLPQGGTLRFGGDGRAVAITKAPSPPIPLPKGEGSQRFKLILTTPGLFPEGWKLPGLQDDNLWKGPDGCTAKLVCAAVPRAETISGWDLAKWAPKPAQRAAPIGSVYWFEDFSGDPAALRKLVETGLWGLSDDNDEPQRKAEGFNNVAIGSWT